MKNRVAYSGPCFTIEWYFNEAGKSQSLEYFEGLIPARQDQVLKLFKLMGDRGEIRNIRKFRDEGEKIFAFKPMPDRFLCFFVKGRKIIVTNAFEKKQDKLPPSEKEKAMIFKKDFGRRSEEGSYYGK